MSSKQIVLFNNPQYEMKVVWLPVFKKNNNKTRTLSSRQKCIFFYPHGRIHSRYIMQLLIIKLNGVCLFQLFMKIYSYQVMGPD